jgi:2-polyprenyl-3-methyl-5-hydroxy-6-metoxy-1,4-benzoquinol methylase
LNKVPGTKGYEKVVNAFTEASLKLNFREIHPELYDLLPSPPARILDAGSGVGQNAAAFAQMGFDVVAVEPLEEFLAIAKSTFSGSAVRWLQDSLPALDKIDTSLEGFDFILLEGVWHHLNRTERKACIKRFSELMNSNGICAITLRNGPAGAGKHLFPTDTKELLEYADEFGFKAILKLENLPSIMNHKPNVTWAKVVIQKK